MKKNKKPKDFQKTIEKDFESLLQEHGVSVQVLIDFPEYKIVPEEIRLALRIIEKHKHNFVLNFIEVKKEK